MRKLNNTTPAPRWGHQLPAHMGPVPGDGQIWYAERPVMPATLEGQVLVPLAWSGVTAGIVAVAVGAAALFFGWPWLVPAVLVLLVFLVCWLAFSGFLRSLLHVVESLTGEDLDKDGKVGGPKTTIRVEIEQGGKLVRIFDPDIFGFASDAAFREFCRRLMAMGGSLTEATWAKDKVSFPGGINDFRKARAKMEEAGYIVRAGNTWEPTRTLMAVCRAVVGTLTHSHTNGDGKIRESDIR